MLKSTKKKKLFQLKILRTVSYFNFEAISFKNFLMRINYFCLITLMQKHFVKDVIKQVSPIIFQRTKF